MATASVEIRPVRVTDRERVGQITADVWEGHDYIDRVFDDWVTDPGAWFQAAEVEGELVGVQRLRPIAPKVVWYEGLRVATAHRRQGLARAMLTAAVAQARGLGFAELRLATANPDAIGLFQSELETFLPFLLRSIRPRSCGVGLAIPSALASFFRYST